MMEATIIPKKTALPMDFPYFIGLRFFAGILDIESVSITTKVRMVRFDLISGLSTSPGKNPADN